MLGRDSRRIQGPSQSKPVSQFIKENHESDSSSERLLRDENGLRADGRRLDEIRPVYLRTGKSFLIRKVSVSYELSIISKYNITALHYIHLQIHNYRKTYKDTSRKANQRYRLWNTLEY